MFCIYWTCQRCNSLYRFIFFICHLDLSLTLDLSTGHSVVYLSCFVYTGVVSDVTVYIFSYFLSVIWICHLHWICLPITVSYIFRGISFVFCIYWSCQRCNGLYRFIFFICHLDLSPTLDLSTGHSVVHICTHTHTNNHTNKDLSGMQY